jgi:hypothetical protein
MKVVGIWYFEAEVTNKGMSKSLLRLYYGALLRLCSGSIQVSKLP